VFFVAVFFVAVFIVVILSGATATVVGFGIGSMIGGFSSAPNTRSPEELVPDPAKAAASLKLLWISCGDRDGLFYISHRTHAYLKDKNVPHVWHVDSGGHDFTVWANDLYLFAQRIFR
jgi:enterochelin esterase-like enzyme